MVVDGAGVEPASRILVHLTVVSAHEKHNRPCSRIGYQATPGDAIINQIMGLSPNAIPYDSGLVII